MDDKIQELLDKQSIYEVLITYCRGVDRCDEDLLRSVYHDDSYDDHGYWRGNGVEFATFVTNRLKNANSATTHSITNAMIKIKGDMAWSESQVVATLVRKGYGPLNADVMGARYLDEMSRRSGVWRISKRTVVLDWHRTEIWSDANAPVPVEGFSRGARFPDDPVYGLLGPDI
ncbi:SnoaL-like domain-containing protein [Collimonas sp. OK607]|uniref:nuclear transport factor 2 family protein n=1 Tax=Collimonas sp. OK607 TaxID=1798194 RepID=UPI0008E7B496|nr:nuclear transport factor 2 family protein [Collimonas sp. OK607]SFB35551.1 SnoaL-like domain-containing protein [Collimonas sp. OK607]